MALAHFPDLGRSVCDGQTGPLACPGESRRSRAIPSVKILWVKSDFLHPTTKGGQIRTLEMLRRLRLRHKVHYVAFVGSDSDEALRRSSEYCEQTYPIAHRIPSHRSLRFAWQLVQGLISKLPVA